jgi:peptidoglycan/xylan/chitin deacetylase (PgdA/CDA1 family)
VRKAVKRSLGLVMKSKLAPGVLALTAPTRFLVLTYHRVNDDGHPFFGGVPLGLFRRQMETVRRLFSVLPLEELVRRSREGTAPRNGLAVTFDDGYRDNFDNAFPVLRELGLPATIFLVPDAIDGDPLIWHDRVFDAFHRTGKGALDFEGRRLPLATLAEREASLRVVLSKLRSSKPEVRDALIEGVLVELGVKPDSRGFPKLTWDQVRSMASGGISFGAHTLDHPILSRVSAEEARRQVGESKRRIESQLDREVTAFAYPNGSASDFDAGTEKIVEAEGFAFALTTVPGANDARTPPFRLHRVGMWGDDPSLSALRLAWGRRRFFH